MKFWIKLIYVFYTVFHQHDILILKMFETSGMKLIKLRVRITNKWLKKTIFNNSYEKLC